MTATKTEGQASVIAVYPDHASAEDAVRRLQEGGIPMQNLSIVGKDFQSVEKPLGFVTTGTVAKSGAKVGAWTGGIFGLLVGAAFLILPGIGPVVIAGPLGAALLGGVEGALAGAAFGGLAGALSAWASARTRPSATNHKSRPANSWSSCKGTQRRSSAPSLCSRSARPRQPKSSGPPPRRPNKLADYEH